MRLCIRNESERFEAYVIPVTETGCWIWIGPSCNGYGSARKNKKNVRAHRYSWEQVNGQIPPGMCVCHKCDTPLCVNPEHLFLAPQKGNIRDMDSKGRRSAGERHAVTLRRAGLVKLTEPQVLSIRSDPRGNVMLAALYGVTKENISSIKLQKTWKYL